MPWRARIITDPAVLAGKPVVRGTRLAVDFLLELLDAGWPEAKLLDQYPQLTPGDIRACRAFRHQRLR